MHIRTLLLTALFASSVLAQDFTWHTNELDQIVLDSYTGTDVDVVMPDEIEGLPVVRFGETFQSSETQIESLVLSTNITFLEDWSLADLPSLRSVVLPPNLSGLGHSVFQGSGIVTATVPASVTAFGENIFNQCRSLATVYFEEGCSVVPNGMFSLAAPLSSVSLASTITHIDSGAFLGSALSSITIPPSVGSLGVGAFTECESLGSVYFEPGALTNISSTAFYGCLSLTNATLPDGVVSIGNQAFYWSDLRTIVLPSSVTSLGTEVFFGCSSATSAIIGAGIVHLPAGSFRECASLLSVQFEGDTASIDSHAFRDNVALPTLALPDSLGTIAASAFQGCITLSEILLGANSALTNVSQNAFSDCAALSSISVPVRQSPLHYGAGNPALIVIPSSESGGGGINGSSILGMP
ncbi:MAG TPA: leucine-rich repeat protein [Kiritimatiellia bacterium]|nr:leucine-rich repeat protein [Kiritimatiellia bacterium]